MSPQLLALLINTAATSLPELIKLYQQYKLSGQISIEDQAIVEAALTKLRADTFSGPEWKVTE